MFVSLYIYALFYLCFYFDVFRYDVFWLCCYERVDCWRIRVCFVSQDYRRDDSLLEDEC